VASREWSFRVDDTGLRDRLRDLRGRFQQGSGAIRRANQRSIEWLGQRAAKNLDDKVHRYKDARNPVSLAEIVANPDASRATTTGFDFLIDQRVAALSARAAAYYRVIEGVPGREWGSTYWVGRTIRLQFYGSGGVGGQAARPASYRRGGRQVTITKGVLAYHYADEARTAFVKGRMWYRFAYDELRAVGIRRG
jgi:hypothetical protein